MSHWKDLSHESLETSFILTPNTCNQFVLIWWDEQGSILYKEVKHTVEKLRVDGRNVSCLWWCVWRKKAILCPTGCSIRHGWWFSFCFPVHWSMTQSLKSSTLITNFARLKMSHLLSLCFEGSSPPGCSFNNTGGGFYYGFRLEAVKSPVCFK
jgi:hypothetical protein